MQVAGWLKVSKECLSDVESIREYLNLHRKIKAKIFNKINKDQSKVAFNYASLVLDLISAKKEIKDLKRRLKLCESK